MELDPAVYDGLLLPGGHAPGTRQYLGSVRLQEHVASFFELERPTGAICHGVLVAARSIDRRTGHSVLYERTTTSLTKYQELGGYLLTAWKLGRYYRTYYTYVEDEVKNALRDADLQFRRGPLTLSARDSETDAGPAFVVRDGTYVSARWPGDAYTFARTFQELLGT
jgi:putative intracellular protease/amidase